MTGLALHLGARLVDHARDAVIILGARVELARGYRGRIACRWVARVVLGSVL